ncbi:MAG: DUF4838 domain-containing protein [Planctomycetota bacterium]|nr:DUF4838 domain-containing protein [Planctomycetota bacterium]
MRYAILAAGCFLMMNTLGGEPFVLAKGGQAQVQIVVAADATEAEKYAAQELAAYLGKLSGATFAVGDAAAAKDGPAIRLKFAADFGGEEYEIKAEAASKSLTISGGRPRGVLYGVYGLLEDHLGCRWYTRDCEKVEKKDPLSVPGDLNQRVKPRLEYREVFWTEALEGDWTARNRQNAANAKLTAKHGGKIVYGTFVHTFERILSSGKEFAAHPEYFSMVKGKRVGQNTQLCLTNPEVLEIAIKTVKEWIAKNPTANIFSVSQNDCHNPCECPNCKAIDDAEGSHAGTLIKFVNAIGEAIEKDHPQVAIDTLAYQYTRKPPKSVIPRPNVIVRLCSIECCFSHPLDGCPEKTNVSFVEDLKGWNKLTKRLYIWDYTTDFSHYIMPFPNLGVLDKNVRTFADNGVVGIFEQGNYSPGGGGELSELRGWVLAKLLWDPSRNGEELIKEFIAGAYGPAAAKVQQFIDLEREAVAKSGEHVRIFDAFTRGYLEPENLREWDKALGEAEKIATDSGDAKLLARVQRLRVPIWYTQVSQAKEPIETLKNAASRLIAVADEQKITHFHEWTTKASDIKRLQLLLARKPVTPAPGVILGEDHDFRLHREGDLATLVADAKAEDGAAAKQPGRTLEWSVAWDIPTPKDATGVYVLRARIRIEKKSDTGPAFHVGAYDSVARKSLGEIRIQAKDVPNDEYKWFDVCELELKPGRYAYVAPDNNEATVTAIYTDRFELAPKGK